MSYLLEQATTWLKKHEWNYHLAAHDNGERFIAVVYEGENTTVNTRIDHGGDQVLFLFSYLPFHCSEEKRGVVAELIARINQTIIFGHFDLDFSDGEVRYRNVIFVENDELTDTTMEGMFYAALDAADTYFPLFMTLLYGNKSPAEIVNAWENEQPDASDDDMPSHLLN